MLKKVIQKMREGMLREIIAETKWIYRQAKPYRGSILLYILLGVAAILLGLGSSIASKFLIDAVTGRSGSIAAAAVCYGAFALVQILFQGVTRRISAVINVRAGNEIRAGVFARFLDVDWQASLDYHSGDLLSRVNSDVGTVSDSILGWIPSLITGLVQFIGSLAIILFYDPMMALIALLSAPVMMALSRTMFGKMREFGKDVRRAQADLIAFYEESLQNLQAIKSFSLHEQFTGRLHQLQGLYRTVTLDYNRFSVRIHLLLGTVGFLVSGGCFAWGVYRLWQGHITFGTMTLFLQLAGTLSSAFSSLVALVPSAISATVAAGRIMTILDLPCENHAVTPEAQAVLDGASAGVGVAVDHVSFAYRQGQDILTDFTLHAAPGEIIGVVSPSGGGKTTLIRLLLGLIFPQSGTVTLESGGAQATLSPALRPLISYVAQEKVVFSGTVRDCLRLSDPTADDGRLEEALRLSCAWDFVSALPQGLDTLLGERGAGLSEGQIQRLAIARAILSPAPVMLLDEATSALDPETEKAVLRGLLARRRTVVVTTHRPSVLTSCTRVYAIRDGRAVLLSGEEIAQYGK